MLISILVAVSSNGVIGKDNDIPWRLPNDLKYVKRTTLGHHIILGRKCYQSIGKALPRRTNIVITRQQKFEAPGCVVVHSLEAALALAQFNGESEAFILGGAEIYKLALPLAKKIYWTDVDVKVDQGTVFFPEINWSNWEEKECLEGDLDEKNLIPHRFKIFEVKT